MKPLAAILALALSIGAAQAQSRMCMNTGGLVFCDDGTTGINIGRNMTVVTPPPTYDNRPQRPSQLCMRNGVLISCF